LVSIVIPAYNAERTIARTIKSACRQTYRNIEIVVVDDGSTDRTYDVVAELIAIGHPTKIIRQANLGVASARNRGIDAAAGELIAPLDADDIWHESKIEKQVALITKKESVGFVYTYSRSIDADDRVLASSSPYEARERAFYQHLFLNFVGNGSSVLMKKCVATAVGGYDTELRQRGLEGCEDYLLQLMIADRWLVDVVPEWLVGYRRTVNSMSSDPKRMFRSNVEVRRRLREHRIIWPRYVDRWALARLRMAYGREMLGHRRWIDAAWYLAMAAWADPVTAAYEVMPRVYRKIFERVPTDENTEQPKISELRSFHEYAPDSVLSRKRISSARLAALRQADQSRGASSRTPQIADPTRGNLRKVDPQDR
jgi:glycosyltransferase involved in cell wall biosynthesis